MKLKIHYGTEVCTIPLRAVSEKGAERTDLLVLLNLSACPSMAEDIPALAKKIGCTVKKTESAIDFWIECGVFERVENGSDEEKITAETGQSHEQEKKIRKRKRVLKTNQHMTAQKSRQLRHVTAVPYGCLLMNVSALPKKFLLRLKHLKL